MKWFFCEFRNKKKIIIVSWISDESSAQIRAFELSKFAPTIVKVKNGRVNWLAKFREFHLPRPSRSCSVRVGGFPSRRTKKLFCTALDALPWTNELFREADRSFPCEELREERSRAVSADELAKKLERENKLGQWQRKLPTMSRKRGGNSAKRRDSKADNNELHFPSKSVRLISVANEKPLHRRIILEKREPENLLLPDRIGKVRDRAMTRIFRKLNALLEAVTLRNDRFIGVRREDYSRLIEVRNMCRDRGSKGDGRFLPAKRLLNNVKRFKTIGISREKYLKGARS